MLRKDSIAAVYPQLETRGTVVVTIMGAVAAELQGLGHRPNFFYLQHAMGLASSLGLGIALAAELKVVVFDGDGSLLRPRRTHDARAVSPAQSRARRVRQSQPALGGRLSDRDRHRLRS